MRTGLPDGQTAGHVHRSPLSAGVKLEVMTNREDFTSKDVAARLGVKPRTVTRYCEQGVKRAQGTWNGTLWLDCERKLKEQPANG